MTNESWTSGPAIANRIAWTVNTAGTWIAARFASTDKGEKPFGKFKDIVFHPTVTEEGDQVVLFSPRFTGSSNKFVFIILTDMNEDELNNTKKIIDTAFAHALPIVQRRDIVAEEAYQRGEDFYARSYKGPTKVISRSIDSLKGILNGITEEMQK